VVNPAIDSTYSLIVDINGCMDTTYYPVTVNALPTPTITGVDTICIGESTTLFAAGGNSYVWDDTSTLDSLIVSPTADMNYVVTATDGNNCSNTANIDIVVNALPSPAIAGTTTICTGFSTTLTASGGDTYVWNNGATTPAINVSPTADSTYLVTATNANGCSDTTSVTVQVLTQPNGAVLGLNAMCIGDVLTLTATGGGTYTWNDGSALDSIVVNPTIDSTYSVVVNISGCLDTAYHAIVVNALPVPTIAGIDTICNGQATTLFANGGGNYTWDDASTLDSLVVSPTSTTTYNLLVTDGNNCQNTTSMDVIVNALPAIIITGVDSLCNGQTTTLTATGGNSYVWSTTEITPSIDVSPTISTSYNVVGTDLNGCVNTDNFTLNILPQPTATISGIAEICAGGQTTLTVDGSGTSYVWSNTETTSSIVVSPTDTTLYTVTTFINSCASNVDSITVNVVPNPSVIVSSSSTSIMLGQSVQLTALGDAPFTWIPASGLSCSACPSSTATPSETTTYCAEVTKDGCPSTDCVTIEVENECGDIFVPDAFSPNNDGNNDCLKVYNNCLEDILFRVYSRWGELLYETTDIDGCWDGTHQGKALNTGVYAFIVQATLVNGDEIEAKGNVTLFK